MSRSGTEDKRRNRAPKPPPQRLPVWYAAGLRFGCTRCGKCCRDRDVPTYVFLEDDEIQQMADFLNVSAEQFRDHYCSEHPDGFVLRNRPGACVFWDPDMDCVIYPVRPSQCRTWPFWPSNLRRENWDEAAAFCPGCNRGRLHSRAEVEHTTRQMLGGRGDGSLWPGEIPLPG